MDEAQELTISEPISLWDSSSDETEKSVTLDGSQSCDLAIIGGGYTGLSTALHAAEKGLDCIVLEAQRIGHGGSGRNVGLVNAGLWLPPQDVKKKLGEERGTALVRRLGESPDYVYGLIEKHQMRCEATRAGTLHAAHSLKGYKDLARRAEGWRALGAPVELLDKDAAAKKIGTERFHGALLDRRAGTINPMGYARGLARAAAAAGPRIATETPVQSLERKGDNWHLRTPNGEVVARNVVLATNAYSGPLWRGLENTFTPIQYFQMSTKPLGDRAKTILPEGQGLWDTAPVMFSLRRDAAGRLIIGSMGAVHGGKIGLSKRWAERRLEKLFPDLGPVEFESAWNGDIAMTPDHIFRIHRLAEGLYAPIGYNGRGIITGTLFGQVLADLLTGASEDVLPVPVTDTKPVAARNARAQFFKAAFAINQWLAR